MAMTDEERKAKARERARKWREDTTNRERMRLYLQAYYQENKEAHRERSKVYNEANKEKLAEAKQKWANANRDKTREASKRWRKRHPEKHSVDKALCRLSRRKARVELTAEEKAELVEIYAKRNRLTEETGIPHHVDHIIPISKGGLHHPDNLRVITAEENLIKGASLETDITARD